MIVGTAKENKTIGCRTGRIPAGFKGLSGPGRRMLPVTDVFGRSVPPDC